MPKHVVLKLRHRDQFFLRSTMTTQSTRNADYTTNFEDQNEVAKLEARLIESNSAIKTYSAGVTNVEQRPLPSVEISDGVHKYVLIKAELDGDEQYVVTSINGAPYHRNAAEPMIVKFQNAGYTNIEEIGRAHV